MAQRFELSLHPDYVPSWGVTEGIREILQNAIDQEIVNPRNKMTVDYQAAEQRLSISSKSSSLDKSSLLLGCSSKGNDDDLVGQFGEGYKLAMLVLTRAGKKVVIHNYLKRELWEAKIINSRRYDSQLLCVDVDKHTFTTPPNNDLTFVIDEVTGSEWTDIVKSNLRLREYPENIETSMGCILLDESEAGQIYVNGLFISGSDAKYGYNFKPSVIKLDRDRGMIRDFDLFWVTSQMWLANHERPEFIRMLSNEELVPDVQYTSDHIWGDHKATAIAYTKFVEEHGVNAHPVSSESEIAAVKRLFPKAKTVIVNSSYSGMIKKSAQFKDKIHNQSDAPPPQKPEEMLRKHLMKFKKKMGIAELNNFNRLISASIFWKDSRL